MRIAQQTHPLLNRCACPISDPQEWTVVFELLLNRRCDVSSERIDEIINELEEVPTSLEVVEAGAQDPSQIHVTEEDLELKPTSWRS